MVDNIEGKKQAFSVMGELYKKLLEIRKAVPYLQKTETNQGMRFVFVPSSQVLAAIRTEMDKQGVLLIPNVLKHEAEIIKTAKGGNQFFTKLDMQFCWVDVETGAEIICKGAGQGVDMGERGLGKALTYAEKYFLLKFFNIPTDKDDPDRFEEKKQTWGLVEKKEQQPKPAPSRDIPAPIGRALPTHVGQLLEWGAKNGISENALLDNVRYYCKGTRIEEISPDQATLVVGKIEERKKANG